MRFSHARRFNRHLRRLPQGFQEKLLERQLLFAADRSHPLLNDHALHEPWAGCRSFSVTGDVRVIYRLISSDLCEFLDIGTHHDLYGS